MLIRYAYIALVLIVWSGCASTTEGDISEDFPTMISGKIVTASGTAIANAKVSLIGIDSISSVFSAANGTFRFAAVPKVQLALRAERLGYESAEIPVPKTVNGTSTVTITLQTKSYTLPAVKPVSTGPVRIINNVLETDFDGDGTYHPFVIKGAAFSPVPIGDAAVTPAVYDRSILYLKGVNANTVRTYSGVDKYFLRQAAQQGIRVIVSFWVNLDLDLSLGDVRETIVEDFASMVLELKDAPGVLMWNIGNEQNYSSTPNNGNSPYWYSLTQEMAKAAYKVEGEKYHPVCINNGNLHNIGSTSMRAHDSLLTYVDCWASNAYEQNFTNFFTTYRTRSKKPIVITEFGIDALNNVTKTEHEAVQAYYDSTNWMQIRSASDVCLGATVFEFTDEWWKAGDPLSHDYGGYATGSHPDGYSNEEWWGIIAVTPDADGDGADEWRTRKAYDMFKRVWQ